METALAFEISDRWPRQARKVLRRAIAVVRQRNESMHDVNHGRLFAMVMDVALILERIRVDHETLTAAILFHGLFRSQVTESELETEFGLTIANLYAETERLLATEEERLSLVGQANKPRGEKSEANHMMLVSMLNDVRVVFILLAHQLSIMRHLKDHSAATQTTIAQETQDVFAPLANRLGIGQLKWELEDLAFRYLAPTQYKAIAKALEERRSDREQYMQQVVAELQAKLQDADIPATVYGRPKHIYSIWRKMQQKNLAFNELYDVRAVRVMADDITSCYAALGVVHSHWIFVPDEYDDYIAAPKANLYQSLHTAVLGPNDQVVEIQIRTQAMHEHAELGVAAHWRYKEGGGRDEELEAQIEKLRVLLAGETRIQPRDATLYVNPVTSTDTVYVLTPQGKVIELEGGATPLDFAYHVHTEVGHHCRGAKVNGKMVTLTTPLKSGQRVEIITAKQGQPSRDWLISHHGYLKTARARAKVRYWFKRQFKDEHIVAGRAAVTREVELANLGSIDWEQLTHTFNFTKVNDLYAAVGRGELGVNQVLNTLVSTQAANAVDEIVVDSQAVSKGVPYRRGIQIHGVGDLLTTIARCCKPMVNEAIVGFITKDRGISIHRTDCSNVKHFVVNNKDRLVEVSWGEAGDLNRFEVDIDIESIDRSGLLRDITSLLATEQINVLGANTRTNKAQQEAIIKLTIEVSDGKQLNSIIAKLIQLKNVYYVQRVGG